MTRILMTMNPKKESETPFVKTAWAGAVLAGGHSKRFGSNKLELPLPNGKTVCEQVGAALRPHCRTLYYLSSVLPSTGFNGFVRLEDWQTEAGPMAGIMAGLHALEEDWLLVVGGDMPWITEGLVTWLQSQVETQPIHPWCGLSGKRLEPLFSAWPKSLAGNVSQLWEEGMRSPQTILKTLKVQACLPPRQFGGVKMGDPLRSINRSEDWDSLLLEWKPSSHPPQSAN